MTTAISIISGKGGVGKTTTAINLGLGLLQFGQKPLVIDAAFHTPTIGIHLGSPKTNGDLHQLLQSKIDPKKVIHRHRSGLRVIPTDTAHHLAFDAPYDALPGMMDELEKNGDPLILDTSPGLGEDVRTAIHVSSHAVIVTTPDLGAVSGALRVKQLCKAENVPILGIILNRVRKDKAELTQKNVEELLELPLLSAIPEDNLVRLSQRIRHPVLHSHPDCNASKAFKVAAAETLSRL